MWVVGHRLLVAGGYGGYTLITINIDWRRSFRVPESTPIDAKSGSEWRGVFQYIATPIYPINASVTFAPIARNVSLQCSKELKIGSFGG